MGFNLALRFWLSKLLPRDGPIVGGLATGLTIQLLGVAFKRIALALTEDGRGRRTVEAGGTALTEWECWRTDAQHEDALIAKTFLFEVRASVRGGAPLASSAGGGIGARRLASRAKSSLVINRRARALPPAHPPARPPARPPLTTSPRFARRMSRVASRATPGASS
jgi:hypothetical protein